MKTLPSNLTGTSKLVPWLNDIRAGVLASRIKSFVGGKISQTAEGVVLEIPTPKTKPVFFPFKIYPSPPHDASTDWRTFRVRVGYVDSIAVGFTDSVDWPDESEVPAYDSAIDFAADDDVEKYYFWIDMTTPAVPEIDHGATEPDYGTGDFIRIGWVDTHTGRDQKLAHIFQELRSDLPVKVTICDATGSGRILYLPGGKQ